METENIYTGMNNVESKMLQSESYGFIEAQGRINRFSYGVGAGVTRSWFKESGRAETYYVFNPSVRMGYTPHDNTYLRYSFNIKPSIPSLGSLTNVEQAVDTIQLVRGNPYLETFKIYENNFSFNFSKDKFSTDLSVKYSYQDKPIMESIFIENEKVVIMDKNQKSFQALDIHSNINLRDITVGSLPDFFSLYAYFGYSYFWSKGLDYYHTFDSWHYTLFGSFYYKKFQLDLMYRKVFDSLFGESIRYRENMTMIGLSYKHKKLEIGGGIDYPFTNNYHETYERKNKIAPNRRTRYIDEIGQMPYIRLVYNFNFGRKYDLTEREQKHTDTDAGILKTDR